VTTAFPDRNGEGAGLVEVVEGLRRAAVRRDELRRAAGVLHRIPRGGELYLLRRPGAGPGYAAAG
jgi:hypothetical protein